MDGWMESHAASRHHPRSSTAARPDTLSPVAMESALPLPTTPNRKP
jgi:hypothetical protein